MAISYYDKPSWIPADKLDQVTATSKGWVYTRDDGIEEVLVGIGNLDTLQVPVVAGVTTNKTAYVIQTDSVIIFTVLFSTPIISDTLTSSTVLSFDIDTTTYSAPFTEAVGDNGLKFTYTLVGDELESGSSVTSLLINEISLNTGEKIQLDYEGYTGDDAIDVNTTIATELVTVLTRSLIVTPTPSSSRPMVTATVTATVTQTQTATVTATATQTVTATVTETVPVTATVTETVTQTVTVTVSG